MQVQGRNEIREQGRTEEWGIRNWGRKALHF
jgi:hypothetical protein